METIAAFDFDGTLTRRDSLFPFLLFTHGNRLGLTKISRRLPAFASYLMGLSSRQEIKEKILTDFYRGKPLEEMKRWGMQFANGPLDSLLRKEAKKVIAMHQRLGHRCILISASLDVYLDPWAKRHGFQEVVCSGLELDVAGQITGKLSGLNCWGEEKKRRLTALLGNRDRYRIHVYGDSRGDKEILAMADYPHYRDLFW